MSFVESEIHQQPAAWQRAAELAPHVSAMLPRSGERVAVVGCGTSWFMAEAYALLRESAGAGETDFFTATHFPRGRRYDRVVAISRSGTTTEILQLIDELSCPVTAITADGSTPIISAAGDTIVLDFADERSVVQTLFATTTLMLLRAQLGQDLSPVIDQASAVLADPAIPAELGSAAQYSFLGQGWAHGIAREAALKMREAAQLWTEAYPQMEYRHGPISIAEPGRAVWVYGEPMPGLREDILATGASLRTSTLDPVADLVTAQLLAARRATQLGLDADRPRHLTRSVILPA
ncbi:sugar isomerase [Jatrophihabitans telluris]|uniref:Sugar isomerase n=1 Tax=Jatrophihabitans telluris TaxID=2038343 RepID=A0ABY4R689_9ACTN|nr:sugar isomerase [Jatrophihabitans telluris]UQX90270.1 sugar isomerase [Jatrophihabitans telluris]